MAREMDMQLGTAQITKLTDRAGIALYRVRYMNTGSFLRNEPRYFETAQEAEDWCHEGGLRIVAERNSQVAEPMRSIINSFC